MVLPPLQQTTFTDIGGESPRRDRSNREKKKIADWSTREVHDFLNQHLPNHECHRSFRYSTGSTIARATKSELRAWSNNAEAGHVMWAELERLRLQEAPPPPDPEPFMIQVRTSSHHVVEVVVAALETVWSVKGRLAASFGIPVERQRLIWKGVSLADGAAVASYHVPSGGELRLIERLKVGSPATVAPPAPRGELMIPGNRAWRPAHASRPVLPLVCADKYRPFPIAIEFESTADYKTFLDGSLHVCEEPSLSEHSRHKTSPILEMTSNGEELRTEALLDERVNMLHLNSIGDIRPNSRSKAVLRFSDRKARNVWVVTGNEMGHGAR